MNVKDEQVQKVLDMMTKHIRKMCEHYVTENRLVSYEEFHDELKLSIIPYARKLNMTPRVLTEQEWDKEHLSKSDQIIKILEKEIEGKKEIQHYHVELIAS